MTRDLADTRCVGSKYATGGFHTNRHKYIECRELKDMDELYDLEADPFEEHNLGSAEARPTLDRMRSELRRVLAETGYAARRESAPPEP